MCEKERIDPFIVVPAKGTATEIIFSEITRAVDVWRMCKRFQEYNHQAPIRAAAAELLALGASRRFGVNIELPKLLIEDSKKCFSLGETVG